MTSDTRLGVEYLAPHELADSRARGWRDVLGIALYSGAGATLDAGPVPVARIQMQPLDGRAALCEVWRSRGPCESGTIGPVHFRRSRDFAFGCVALTESGGGTGADDGRALHAAAERAYGGVFACLDALGLEHIIRIWNYLPDINREAGGLERYRRFNEARQRAFKAFRGAVNGNVPAACALGSPPGGALVVYFLAGAQPATAIESPRQIPAYSYPPEYGAFSPTFSRATLTPSPGGPMLFVSGTASIVGHRTVHAGDVIAQTHETVANIRALIGEANRIAGAPLFATERLRYKTYLRRPADVAGVVAELEQALCPAEPIAYLNADVCRSELLVEIEAVGFGDRHGAS